MSSDATHFSDLFDTRYYTREQLRELRAKLDGLDAGQEQKFRRQMHKFVEKMCAELKMNPWVGESAMVFIERFFSQRSYSNNDRFLVAAGALFMAAKARDNPRPIRHVAHAYHKVKLSGKPQDLAAFLKDAERIIADNATVDGLLCAERALLYTLRFDVREYFVHNAGGAYSRAMGLYPSTTDQPAANTYTLDQQKLLSQLVMNFQKDIFKTQLMLQIPPEKAAACCVLMAAERAGLTMQQPPADELDKYKLKPAFLVSEEDYRCFKTEVLSLYNEIEAPQTKQTPAAAAAPPPAAAAAAGGSRATAQAPHAPSSRSSPSPAPAAAPAASGSAGASTSGSGQPPRAYSRPPPPPPPSFHAHDAKQQPASAPAASAPAASAGQPEAPSPPDPQLRSINDDQNNNNNTPAQVAAAGAAATKAAGLPALGVAPSLEEGELPDTAVGSTGGTLLPPPPVAASEQLPPPASDGAGVQDGPAADGVQGRAVSTAPAQPAEPAAAAVGCNGHHHHPGDQAGSRGDGSQGGAELGPGSSGAAALGRKRSRDLACLDAGGGCSDAADQGLTDRDIKVARVVHESAV